MNEEPSLFDTKRQEQVFSHNVDSSNEDEPLRMARLEPWFQANTMFSRLQSRSLKVS